MGLAGSKFHQRRMKLVTASRQDRGRAQWIPPHDKGGSENITIRLETKASGESGPLRRKQASPSECFLSEPRALLGRFPRLRLRLSNGGGEADSSLPVSMTVRHAPTPPQRLILANLHTNHLLENTSAGGTRGFSCSPNWVGENWARILPESGKQFQVPDKGIVAYELRANR